jgi:hypothetical protein
MTKREKALERLLGKPKDFTWDELLKVLTGFDYKQDNGGKTSGSRVRFIHTEYAPISLHKPHPKPVLKRYQIEDVINLLKQEKLI